MRNALGAVPRSSSAGPVVFEIAARKVVFYGCLIFAALEIANILAQLVRWVWDIQILFALVPLFDLDGEGNLPNLFSVFLLASCAALLAGIGAFEARREARRYWYGMSIVAAYVMIDEGAQIHELVGSAIHHFLHTSGYLYYGWVIPATAVLGTLGFLYARFFFSLEPRLRLRLAVGVVAYVAGAYGMELISGAYRTSHPADFTFSMMATVEETLEAVGLLLLLRALLLHAAAIGLRVETVIRGFGSPAAATAAASPAPKAVQPLFRDDRDHRKTRNRIGPPPAE
jgi:hypothetical protein